MRTAVLDPGGLHHERGTPDARDRQGRSGALRRIVDLIGGLYDHDWFMVARDFDAYAEAQRKVDELWSTPRKWYSMAIRNTAHVSWFSSDRTIRQYAEEIWKVPV